MDIQKQAAQLEEMCTKGEGGKALDELQAMPREEQLAVIKQLRTDARQEQGQCYIDAKNDQLVFESVFNGARK